MVERNGKGEGMEKERRDREGVGGGVQTDGQKERGVERERGRERANLLLTRVIE